MATPHTPPISFRLPALALLLLAFIFLAGCFSFPRQGSDIPARSGESFNLELPGNPSTGYQWSVLISNESVVRYVGYDSVFCDAAIGSGCDYLYKFQAIHSGNATLHFIYQRPWEDRPPANEKDYQVTVD